jgi:NTE family protein
MDDIADQPMPVDPNSPVRSIPTDTGKKIEVGTALCLSGGGYRAMVFHIGAIWRLHETGMLKSLKRISSVSGGSITAGVLALKWNALITEPFERASFEREFVAPLRALAGETIDIGAATLGLVWPGGVSGRIAAAYDKYVFHGATLQDLPDEPRFVINATNVQSGALWRFMKPYMADWRVGSVEQPKISLARAVTASSAFPPFLSPMQMSLDPNSVHKERGNDLHAEPYTSEVVLTDGGVYDNLGLETAWKHYDTILVSDGGGHIEPEKEPSTLWPQHSYRVLNLIDNQVRALRKRQVIDSYKAAAHDANHRKGAYWGIRTNIADYKLADALNAPYQRTLALAAIATRLASMDDKAQERLINWGYAVCDAALRKHVSSGLGPKPAFPYSGGV